MNDLLKCFTFSVADIANFQKIVHEYRKSPFDATFYPRVNEVPFCVTLKANNEKYPKGIVNPDCELTFVSHENGIYDIHYETPNSILMNVEGMIKPFDYSIRMLHNSDNGKRYEFVKKPDRLAMEFLKSNYKFATNNNTGDVFILGCQIAQFVYAVLPNVLKCFEAKDRVRFALLPNYFEEGMKYIAYQQTQKRKNDLLNGWDVVHLTENQFNKILETNAQHGVEYDDINVPLPKFCLSVFNGGITEYYFFERKGKTVRCGVTDVENFCTKWFNIIIEENNGGNVHAYLDVKGDDKPLFDWLQYKSDDEHEENWTWCANAFFAVNTFMLHYGDVTMDVETKYAEAPSEYKGSKKKHNNTIRLFKSYRLIKGWKGKARKKHEITCTAWGVRGHFRHYKNGKVVFIEPFVKGKERANYVGKEYALMPYSEA